MSESAKGLHGFLNGALEPVDPDEIDFSTSDGVVTIEFPDKTRFVLNRQTAASQMWFAAGARAWHYDWNEPKKAWIDDKEGVELYARIAEKVGQRPGLRHEDVLVNLVEVPRENWSFGNGVMTYSPGP